MSSSGPVSPFQIDTPPMGRLLRSLALAFAGAGLVLLLFVLPAEYGIDPTGVGKALGLTDLSRGGTRVLQIKDVIGGNESYRQIQVPDAGEPIPLPNPAVFQAKTAPAQAKTLSIKLEPGEETEIKTVLDEGQVVLFSWQAGGEVYTDFHGHEPGANQDQFVRYEEQQSGTAGNGSLVAPFTGEHGWYWVNIGEAPVTITLNLNGYYKDVIDYGILRR